MSPTDSCRFHVKAKGFQQLKLIGERFPGAGVSGGIGHGHPCGVRSGQLAGEDLKHKGLAELGAIDQSAGVRPLSVHHSRSAWRVCSASH
jgi:hypothetical protein